MNPIDVIVADVAKSTLTGCARGIVGDLADLAGGAQMLANQSAAEAAVTECLSVFLQVRASADFGTASAKSLRKFGLALGEFASYADARGQLMRPYREGDCDAAPVAAELERLWRANQEDLHLPPLPAGYWSRAIEEYCAAAVKAITGNRLLERVRGVNAPQERAVLSEALQLLEQHFAADAKLLRPNK
ncbi:MAG: hypothetical protein NTX53_08055 [candidate division WOR-3 bacterium]|nr:hypothetical protein [candidate division WOR-3 bacterium]